MTDRDRLIELINDCRSMDGYGMDLVEKQADHLLANGVIVPPCKVGDTVYEVQLYSERIQAYEVITLKYNGHFWYMVWKLKDDEGIYGNLEGFVDSELGRTVFLTKEEAEAKLKEMKEDG